MKKIIILLCTVIFVTSCASSQLKGPVIGKRIGIILELGDDNTLCYEHLGFTVFSNIYKDFDIQPNTQEVLIKSTIEAIEESGNIPVVLKFKNTYSEKDIITRSAWDGSPVLNKTGITYVNNLSKTHALDYLFMKLPAETKKCHFKVSNEFSGNRSELVNIYSGYGWLALFDNSGVYLGVPPYSGDRPEEKIPNDVNNITTEELEKFQLIFRDETIERVKFFLSK
jgi:hypothetical protein